MVHRELFFEPFPFFSGSHQQTILGSFLNWYTEPDSETLFVPLKDGDKIAIEVTTPKNWTPYSLTVVMVHGLCGSHRSRYLVRMTKKLMEKGIRCIRFNMRGCGSGRGHAKQIYHSGRSDDLREVIEYLRAAHPDSPFVIIGFSLGGNIVLKLAGEWAGGAKGIVEQFIAISPPVELLASVERMSLSANRFYERYFMRFLMANVKERHEKFPDLPYINLPAGISIYEFDELYTAPQCGFQNALDYYTKSSSKLVVPNIDVPCRILFAEDDPLICSTSLDDLELPENILIYKTKKGGHLGFLASPQKDRGFHWMDNLLEGWIFDPEFEKE
jgi:uncharacterized protein